MGVLFNKYGNIIIYVKDKKDVDPPPQQHENNGPSNQDVINIVNVTFGQMDLYFGYIR